MLLFACSCLGFSQQTNYPIVFEAAYVTAQLLLDLAGSFDCLKLRRVERAIYVEDPAAPERPLARGEPPREPGHICTYQCPLRYRESESTHKSNKDSQQEKSEELRNRRLSKLQHNYKRHHTAIFGAPPSSSPSPSSAPSTARRPRAPSPTQPEPRFAANLIESESSDASLNDSDDDEAREAKRRMKKHQVKNRTE